jgi:serine/threonine protein kinase
VSPARHHHALPEGYHLHWYEIDSILGQGGFGITYLARDTNLDQLVAIKEFLPSDLAARTEDSNVQPLSGGHTDTYGWGLNRFLTEARTLAKFRHPNIVRVMSVFEANNTAYMVMEYERGESFENMLKFKQVRGEQDLKRILLALLDGLELVHDSGFIHRDIKPSNVYLREDGVPVLLDFGSARLALGVETRTLTSLVSPGYAPFEQYNATRESDKQGPWTDIYALGATMYRAVTGQGPIDAAARANLLLDEQRDPFEPCSQMPVDGYSWAFLHAIDRALAFAPADRPQSVAAWRRLVEAGAVDTEADTVAVGGGAPPASGVDIVLEDGDDATVALPASTDTTTRTVPMAELEAVIETVATAKSSGRGWFVATSVVAVIGVAVVAWLTLVQPSSEETQVSPRATAAAPETTSSEADRAQPPAQSDAEAGAQAADSATASEPPAPTPTVESADATAAGQKTSTPPSTQAAGTSEPVQKKPSITDAIATAAAPSAAQPAASPAPEKSPAKTSVEKKQTPVATAETPAAPAATVKKTAPEKVAKAAPAPAKKSPEAAPRASQTASKKTSQPRTRAEQIEALLASGDAHLRADRLTKPKKKNALRDYLTVLAMDSQNEAARRGVERIVGRYVTKSETATNARDFEKANEYLRQARFVLDAMKLRKWPQASYNALFAEYRDANQLMATSR